MTYENETDVNNQAWGLRYRRDALRQMTLVRLPGARAGIECPEVMHAEGPVAIAAGSGQIEVQVKLIAQLDPDQYRYRTFSISLWLEGTDGDLDAELLRKLRWGEIITGAVDSLGRVVIVDEDGTEIVHKSFVGLSDEERVATFWLQARLAGIDPNVYIAEQMELSPTAAAGRVRRARAKKLVPAATQGQRR